MADQNHADHQFEGICSSVVESPSVKPIYGDHSEERRMHGNGWTRQRSLKLVVAAHAHRSSIVERPSAYTVRSERCWSQRTCQRSLRLLQPRGSRPALFCVRRRAAASGRRTDRKETGAAMCSVANDAAEEGKCCGLYAVVLQTQRHMCEHVSASVVLCGWRCHSV